MRPAGRVRKIDLRAARACLHSSLRPEHDGNEVDHRGEASIGLFVACGDAAKRFDLAEEVFDQMAPPVFLPVVRGMPACPLAKRDDSFDMSSRQALAQPMGVERFVSDKGQAINAGHENVKTRDIVAMARQQHEADQIAKRIDERRDLRRRTTARFANGLFLSPPFAPVPC